MMQPKQEDRSQESEVSMRSARAEIMNSGPRRGMLLSAALSLALSVSLAVAQTGDLTPVIARPVSRSVDLPAEILPYLSVSLHAKVPGYVESVFVDRGSAVKEGELLVRLTAPEMDAQIAEAESRYQAAEADRLQAEAQLAAPKHLRANSGGG